MATQSDIFGRLLRGAINSIAAYEGKSAAVVEEELGNLSGLSGAAIQRYKAGSLPPEQRTVQVLAEAGARRGYLSRAWLERFLHAARYPSPEALLVRLSESPNPVRGADGEPGLPSGTVTFLFTDIEGSTTRWEKQPQAMERALARHDTLLRQAIVRYGGQVVKTVGDAFQAVFTTTLAGLEAALAAQHALLAEPWGPVGSLRVRMALHVGIVQQRDGDYFGHALNRAARLCAAGHGGQILLSDAAQELVHDLLSPGIELRDLSEHQLKDLARRERIFQLVAPGLPVEFPPLRTLDRYTHNLPAHLTPFIGREAEVLAVGDLLRSEVARLVTLTGPGGIGKTRLGLQVAAELLDTFRDGVTFVPLAPIRDPELVVAALAQALRLSDVGGRPLVEQVKGHLHARQRLLLLDNFEHVAAAGPLIANILTAAPDVKVLVTSREALHLYGEHEYVVPPLRLPDLGRLPILGRLTQYEAVRLFIERAQAARPSFTVTAENAPFIAEICTRLDGLPLAIELAAARSKLFPPHALLTRLNRRLALLTDGPRDLPARQQTLRGAIAWSYDLLDATEQALFARLGVFVGGCTLDAAEAVLGDAEAVDETEVSAYIAPHSVVDALTSLVHKSLVKQEEDGRGEPRFSLLETMREYAQERLQESGEVTVVRRHASFYLSLAEAASTALSGPEQRAALGRLEQEHDNLRAALQRSLDQGEPEIALQLCAALGEFWRHRGHFSEGLRWMEVALGRTPELRTRVRVQVLSLAGHLAFQQSDLARAAAWHAESLALARELGDPRLIASALPGAGMMARKRGELALARALYEESLALHRELGDEHLVPWLLFHLGMVALRQGNHGGAQALGEESLARYRMAEDTLGIAHALGLLGEAYAARGEDARAAALLAESLTLANSVGSFLQVALGLVRLAGGDTARELPRPVARLFGAAEADGTVITLRPNSSPGNSASSVPARPDGYPTVVVQRPGQRPDKVRYVP